MSRSVVRPIDAVALLAAGLLVAAALGLTRTLPLTLGLALCLGLAVGPLLRTRRDLLAVPLAVALGAAGMVALAAGARVASDALPWAVAWLLTVGILVVPALLGAATTASIGHLFRRRSDIANT